MIKMHVLRELGNEPSKVANFTVSISSHAQTASLLISNVWSYQPYLDQLGQVFGSPL